jgi:ubiquinone/menaquinone biosynthesis C-methylase UbiE
MDENARCGSQYVLGHSMQELERLGAQARLYDPFTLQFLRDGSIAPGMRVLDAGCGKGDVSFLAAGLVGHEGRIVGVDRVPDAVEAGRRAFADECSGPCR